MRLIVRAFAALGICCSSAVALAGPYEEAIAEQIAKTNPDVRVSSVTKSDANGLYEVQLEGGAILYSTQDTHYFVMGDLFERRADNTLINLTENIRQATTAKKLAAVPEKEMIIYPAVGKRTSFITVFSDPDCPYCKQLHGLVPTYNASGIEVRYLAFPRTGLGTETHAKMASAWCSEKPAEALSELFKGNAIPEVRCNNPVADQFQLGQDLGVRGTPTMFLPDGRRLVGAIPVGTLIEQLVLKK
jgi:thiol:disulfide interchange protein DsbC